MKTVFCLVALAWLGASAIRAQRRATRLLRSFVDRVVVLGRQEDVRLTHTPPFRAPTARRFTGSSGRWEITLWASEGTTRLALEELPGSLGPAGPATSDLDAPVADAAPRHGRVALLDTPAREAVEAAGAALDRRGVEVLLGRGAVELHLADEHPSAEDLLELHRRAVRIADAIRCEGSLAERLAANALADPAAEIRRTSLALLLELAPAGHPVGVATARAVTDPDLLLLAARWLDDPERLLGLVLDPSGPRRQALAALVAGRHRSAAAAAVEALVEEGTLLPEACAAVIRLRLRETLPVLGRRLRALREGWQTRWPAVRREVTTLALALASLDSEEPLLPLLGAPGLEVRGIAIEALGRVGGRAALAALAEPQPTELAEAALQAAASIRARSSGARAGALSVAVDPAAGALSLPDADP